MNITGETLAFFLLSFCSIGGAIFMINMTRVVHMVLSLAFTFLSLAGIYFLLEAEFLAVIQILIYAGAVSILMLFGIMLTKQEETEPTKKRKTHSTVSFFAVAAFFIMIMSIIYQKPILAGKVDHTVFQVSELGKLLFTKYLVPFELTSLLLLVALIGAIILAKKEEKE